MLVTVGVATGEGRPSVGNCGLLVCRRMADSMSSTNTTPSMFCAKSRLQVMTTAKNEAKKVAFRISDTNVRGGEQKSRQLGALTHA
jgi:hypothetical protein